MGELAEQHRHQLRPATEALGAPFGLVLLDQRSELGARKMLEQLIEQTGCLYDWSALLFPDSGQDRPQQTNRFCSQLIIGGLFLWTASPGTQLKNLFWTRVIRDEILGPIIVRVASFFPFHATYWLNGHSFIEQELKRRRINFQKNDNAFLAVDDAAELQAAADRLSPCIIRKQLNYWTLILGPKFSKRERGQMNLSRFYAIAQIEYCRNFVFKRHFPIHKLFERSCEIGLWRLTANRIREIFGVRLSKRLRGKLATVIDQIEHGHHVFRAYWKNAFLKQYEKFSRFLRNELCSNNLRDFGLKKGLDHLDAVRKRFQVITDRFAGCQAQWLNVHVDFPLHGCVD